MASGFRLESAARDRKFAVADFSRRKFQKAFCLADRNASICRENAVGTGQTRALLRLEFRRCDGDHFTSFAEERITFDRRNFSRFNCKSEWIGVVFLHLSRPGNIFLPRAKIRLKETSQLLSNGIEEEKLIQARLEQTIGIVQQYFIAERATTLPIDLVAKQVRDCHSASLSYRKSSRHRSSPSFYFLVQNKRSKLFIISIGIRPMTDGSC